MAECPNSGYHNASAAIGEVSEAEHVAASSDDWPHDDPNWPSACQCGYVFQPGDRWQRNDDRIYHLPDGTEFAFTRSLGMCAPPGTMIRADWYDDYAGKPGKSWLVALPDGGDWITTQQATGGGYWDVTGEPPLITVSPSIWHNSPNGWHGWIRNGVLEAA